MIGFEDDHRVWSAADHFNAVAKARAEGFECGGKAERIVLERVLELLRVAVVARRRRMDMDGSDVEAEARADDVETRAVCALLDYYEAAHPAAA